MEAWRKELYHHGIKGMHWGVRRYQNPDGSLTPAGQKRQDKKIEKANKSVKSFNQQILLNYAYSKGRLMYNNEKVVRTNIKYANKLGSEFDKLTNRISKNPALASIEKSRIDKKTKKILNKMDDTYEKLKKEEDLIKFGHQKVNDVLHNYSEAKSAAIMDKSYKKTQEYKDAKKAYSNYNMRLWSMGFGEPEEITAAKSYARSYKRQEKKKNK